MARMKALITQEDHGVAVKEIDVPKPAEGEILVKVNAVAQNPTDWKAAATAPPGMIVGCDFAGTVSDANGSSWKEGQRVAGFVQGTSKNGIGSDPRRGVFAEYCLIESSLVFAIPDGTSDQEAAAIPLAFATAVQALFQRLALPESGSGRASSLPVLIYGGTSSVGKYAIQLTKNAGLTVIATGSKRNHELLRKLGADEVVDYNDSDWSEKVKQVTNGKLEHAFDCIAEKGSAEGIAKAMSTNGGHIIRLLPSGKDKDRVEAINSKIKLESTIVYTVFERPLSYGTFDNCGKDKPTPEDKAVWEKYLKKLPNLLSQKQLEANRVREMGGLEDIITGFKEQQAGKVSAEKLVYNI